jgi:hypothetical protein
MRKAQEHGRGGVSRAVWIPVDGLMHHSLVRPQPSGFRKRLCPIPGFYMPVLPKLRVEQGLRLLIAPKITS